MPEICSRLWRMVCNSVSKEADRSSEIRADTFPGQESIDFILFYSFQQSCLSAVSRSVGRVKRVEYS